MQVSYCIYQLYGHISHSHLHISEIGMYLQTKARNNLTNSIFLLLNDETNNGMSRRFAEVWYRLPHFPASTPSPFSTQHTCPVRTGLFHSGPDTPGCTCWTGAGLRRNMPSVVTVFSLTSSRFLVVSVSFLPLVTKSDKKIKVFQDCIFFNRDNSESKNLRKPGQKVQNSPTAAEKNQNSQKGRTFSGKPATRTAPGQLRFPVVGCRVSQACRVLSRAERQGHGCSRDFLGRMQVLMLLQPPPGPLTRPLPPWGCWPSTDMPRVHSLCLCRRDECPQESRGG